MFMWSSCHCGCQREGSDIKRDGWVSCFIICHFGKTQKRRHSEHDNVISHINLTQNEKTLAYSIAPHILSSSVLTRLSW